MTRVSAEPVGRRGAVIKWLGGETAGQMRQGSWSRDDDKNDAELDKRMHTCLSDNISSELSTMMKSFTLYCNICRCK